MPLSRVAAQHAAEIKLMDWSDAPYRADRAGHDRATDGAKKSREVLTPMETERLRLNVMWVTAQVLAYNDPNFDVYEFAEACGVVESYLRTTRGQRNGAIMYGLRSGNGRYDRPGTYEVDAE